MALESIAENLWATTRPFRAFGVATLASRMTVVRLRAGGGLLLHSPVRLDPALRGKLDALGPVRHVVAPNCMHHLFCGDYRAAYPGVRVHGAPGVARKRPDLAPVEPLGDAPPETWAADLDQALVAGIPMLNEVAFLHRASGTLLLTDLAANGGPELPPALRLWLRLNGAYGRLAAPRELLLLRRDRAALRRSLERVLEWDFDRVVFGHGAVVERDAKPRLREAWARLR